MNKIVLVTGASSGIGKCIASYLVEQGMTVFGTSRNPQSEIISGVHMLALDVTNPATIKRAVEEIILLKGSIDILVNNAGMGITGPIEETPMAETKRVFDTNFFGAIEVMNAVLPGMKSKNTGLIINITSIAGYMGLPFRGYYSATKGALALVTESVKMELSKTGIKVCTVAPGDFATNIAAGRYHSPVQSESVYGKDYQKNLDLMNLHVDKGLPPILMAKKIYKIIQTENPKTHYKVGGFMEKFSIVLKRILPDKVYQKMLMKHFGM